MGDDTTLERRATATGVLVGGEHLCLVFYDRRDTVVVRIHRHEKLVVGRAAPADVVIDDPSLSRRHAIFSWDDEGVWVEDAGSTNGVFVAGKQVERQRLDAGVAVLLCAVTASLHVTGARGRSLEGLETHERFMQRTEDEIARARRSGSTFALAYIRALGANAHVEQFVPRLRGQLEPDDRFSIYGESAVLILLPARSTGEALRFAQRIVQEARPGEPSLRVGVASFPGQGSTAAQLLVRARSLSRQTNADQPVVGESAQEEEEQPIVHSAVMRTLYETIARVAPSHLSVLVIGETGSGKELVARAVHQMSGARSSGPLHSVNCGALTDTLLQSALFGHVRGAFTGADADRVGLFESASGGTLFLDEIGELSAAAQAALLRVLESKKVCRVGSTEEISVDVRIVAATHRDLRKQVEEGGFRQDLLYRLEGIALHVPPLRERTDEILLLAERFLKQACHERAALTFSKEAQDLLVRHAWPGNVRELRNAVERAAVICAEETVEAADLPDTLQTTSRLSSPSAPIDNDGRTFKEQVKDYEKGLILSALEASGGNQTLAAKSLGMPLRTLVHKIRSYGIKKKFGAD